MEPRTGDSYIAIQRHKDDGMTTLAVPTGATRLATAMPLGPCRHLSVDDVLLDGGRQRLALGDREAKVLRPLRLLLEHVDYAQSKAVFKAARERAGLRAPLEHRGGVDRLTVEEELRFLDQAYAQSGRTGLMLQTLLETGARASELVQLRVEDVSLAERVITIRQGKSLPLRRRGAASVG